MPGTGTVGEQIAATYLKKSGYLIVETNWRRRWAEIDIVAKDPNGTLVFVEVKTIKLKLDKSAYFQPEDHFDQHKKEKVKKAAIYYANSRGELMKEAAGWRIDLIAITISEKECVVKHYRNSIS